MKLKNKKKLYTDLVFFYYNLSNSSLGNECVYSSTMQSSNKIGCIRFRLSLFVVKAAKILGWLVAFVTESRPLEVAITTGWLELMELSLLDELAALWIAWSLELALSSIPSPRCFFRPLPSTPRSITVGFLPLSIFMPVKLIRFFVGVACSSSSETFFASASWIKI